MRVKKNILFLSIFSIFVGCGGGSTSTTNVGTNEDNSSSEITLNVADELNKKLQFNQNGLFKLNNAPKGMAIYSDGTLTWKPTSDQDGDYAVTVNVLDTHGTVVESKKLDFHVRAKSSVSLADNYVKGIVTTQNSDIDGITKISHNIFNDPTNFDFSIVASLQQDIGASKTARDSMKEKLDRFKIDITNRHQSYDESEQTKTIVETAPGKIDCSHYNDAKPYVRVYDIDSTHPIVADKGLSEFKLYIKHPYGTCVER